MYTRRRPVDIQVAQEADARSASVTTVGILMEKMNGLLFANSSSYQLHVQAGMTGGELMDVATSQNMSVPWGSVPAFAGLTLGGVLATGAHGSGTGPPSALVSVSFATFRCIATHMKTDARPRASEVYGCFGSTVTPHQLPCKFGNIWLTVHASIACLCKPPTSADSGPSFVVDAIMFLQADLVVDIIWVDGKGDVHISKRNSDEGRALCGGVGVLGIITELVLQLQPLSHTKVETWGTVSDGNLAADIQTMLKVGTAVTCLCTGG